MTTMKAGVHIHLHTHFFFQLKGMEFGKTVYMFCSNLLNAYYMQVVSSQISPLYSLEQNLAYVLCVRDI